MIPVFIYGTLKRGFPLHDRGMNGALFKGIYQTVAPYPLYIARSFFGPVMLDRPGEGLNVLGELFDVDEQHLPAIDALEDLGDDGSFRKTLTVEPVGGGVALEALAYFKDETWLEPLHAGPLSDYQDRRFIPPWDR